MGDVPFLDYATASSRARTRAHNEDACGVLGERGLFCLADGIGYAPDGARASQLAVAGIVAIYRETVGHSDESLMIAGFHEANARVWERNRAADEPFRRMGSSLVALQVGARQALVGFLGNSRCYQWRAREMRALTEDHLLLEASRARVSPDELDDLRPLQTVLSRSVGRAPEAMPELSRASVHPGDIFLLCSNGLTDAISVAAIAEVLSGSDSIQAQAEVLVATAHARSGVDDTTVVLVRVHEPHAAAP